VGETIAAVRARAEVAIDDEERRALAIIAEDEERHAELAFAILAFVAARDPDVLRGLARLEASSDLEREVLSQVVGPCTSALSLSRVETLPAGARSLES
jgi:hypothetical protein